jgi:hypothetical protein
MAGCVAAAFLRMAGMKFQVDNNADLRKQFLGGMSMHANAETRRGSADRLFYHDIFIMHAKTQVKLRKAVTSCHGARFTH